MWSWPTTSESARGLIRTARGRPAAARASSSGVAAPGSEKSSLWSSEVIGGVASISACSPQMKSDFLALAADTGDLRQPTMKSSYELAMERLAKSDPSSVQTLTSEQRAKLADVDRVYQGRIAEREIFLRQRLEQALTGQDADEVEKIRKQIVSEKARLEEDRESEKDKIRSAKA